MIESDRHLLPDLFDLLARNWKKIFLAVFISTLVATIIVLIKPKEYLAVATALPASGYAGDKALIFGENRQQLYSSLGMPDELDRIIGTSTLDTLYAPLVDEFSLVADYDLEGKKNSRYRAIKKLKKDTRIFKSEFGELKVKVWHTSPVKAAGLANGLMQHLQQMHQQVLLANNKSILSNLEMVYNQWMAQGADSLGIAASSAVSAEKMQQYKDLITQYRLVIQTDPQALVVVENAAEPVEYDRPDIPLVLGITFVLAFVFSVLLVLLLEKRTRT